MHSLASTLYVISEKFTAGKRIKTQSLVLSVRSILSIHCKSIILSLFPCTWCEILYILMFLCWTYVRFYTTKGRDWFHWAATPLKPYKVGNICYMTYRYSVLYFLNLSLKHFFPHRKQLFLWKYPNPETVIVPCFNVSRMPNRRTSQLCISLLN